MNGFAGIFAAWPHSGDELRGAVRRVTQALVEGGDGGWSNWTDPESGIALASGLPAGAADSPEAGVLGGTASLVIASGAAGSVEYGSIRSGAFESAGVVSGRRHAGHICVVFDGEIYNRRELAADLERAGIAGAEGSDAELVRAVVERWGVEPGIARLNGAFALAIWDSSNRRLTLVRDRLGLKSLYVMARDGVVSFATRLRALHGAPGFDRTVDPSALTQYLRYLYVAAPRTIFRGVQKLGPGMLLTITDPAAPLPAPRSYWSLAEVARRGLEEPLRAGVAEVADGLEEVLSDAVRLRLDGADRPGALLSGGIDSSTVVSLLVENSAQPVKTFALSFDSAEFNEAAHAASVARHLGTDHTELAMTGAEALALVPRLPEVFDEPLADVSQVPAYLICAAARRETAVVFTGDGGDEIFGGYNRYLYGESLLRRVSRIPYPARRLAAAGIGSLSATTFERVYEPLAPILPGGLRHRLAGQKMVKLGGLLAQETVPRMYRSLVSAWQDPESLVVGGREYPAAVDEVLGGTGFSDRLVERMILADQLEHLPDDQLAKAEYVTDATSIRCLAPILDHRVVEFSWRIPIELKVSEGKGKRPLRELLYRRVPRTLVERPKMGFSVPLATWLCGPLRPWAEELLAPAALERGGLLRAAPIRKAWTRLLDGAGGSGLELWAVLVFQAWRERWLA